MAAANAWESPPRIQGNEGKSLGPVSLDAATVSEVPRIARCVTILNHSTGSFTKAHDPGRSAILIDDPAVALLRAYLSKSLVRCVKHTNPAQGSRIGVFHTPYWDRLLVDRWGSNTRQVVRRVRGGTWQWASGLSNYPEWPNRDALPTGSPR